MTCMLKKINNDKNNRVLYLQKDLYNFTMHHKKHALCYIVF